ncbi:MAG: hypothetical protein U0821_12885 [Chloroflexota bacterium]
MRVVGVADALRRNVMLPRFLPDPDTWVPGGAGRCDNAVFRLVLRVNVPTFHPRAATP